MKAILVKKAIIDFDFILPVDANEDVTQGEVAYRAAQTALAFSRQEWPDLPEGYQILKMNVWRSSGRPTEGIALVRLSFDLENPVVRDM